MPTKTTKKAATKARRATTKPAVAVQRKAPRRRAAAAGLRKPRSATPPSTTTKQGRLIAELSTPGGATIAALATLTGWQPHTVRGAISGVLRKRLGLQVVRDKSADGESRYRINGSSRA